MHQIGDTDQRAPETAAGMKVTILIGGKPAPLHQRHRERVAQYKHHGRRRRRRQPHRTGFAHQRQHQRDIGCLEQRRFRFARHADQRNAEALRIRDQIGELRRLAAPRQHQQCVIARQHSKVAVACFGGMNELRRRARGGERGGDLASDVTALAHAADDYAALDGQKNVDSAAEFAVQDLA